MSAREEEHAERTRLVDGHALVSAHDVAAYLRDECHVDYAHAATLQVYKRTWTCAEYAQTRAIHKSTRAYREGKREYTQRGLYVLGDIVPKIRWERAVLRVSINGGSDRGIDWYLAGYYGQRGGRGILDQSQARTVDVEHAKAHPFGRMFLLFPWDHVDGPRIDDWDKYPRPRVAATVTYLPAPRIIGP